MWPQRHKDTEKKHVAPDAAPPGGGEACLCVSPWLVQINTSASLRNAVLSYHGHRRRLARRAHPEPVEDAVSTALESFGGVGLGGGVRHVSRSDADATVGRLDLDLCAPSVQATFEMTARLLGHLEPVERGNVDASVGAGGGEIRLRVLRQRQRDAPLVVCTV